MFIAIEGNDGAGKTTIINMLRAVWESELKNHFAGMPLVTTREPGGTILGGEIRELLLNPKPEWDKSSMTQLLLFMADRRHHLDTLILPAVKDGKVVITDRYVDATYSHQVCGGDVPEKTFNSIVDDVLDGAYPDFTIYLLCEPTAARERMTERQGGADYFDQKGFEFHEAVYNGLIDRCGKKNPGRVVETAGKSPTEVCAEVIKLLRWVAFKNREGGKLITRRPVSKEMKAAKEVAKMVDVIDNPVESAISLLTYMVEKEALRAIRHFNFVDWIDKKRHPETGEMIEVERKKDTEISEYFSNIAELLDDQTEESVAMAFLRTELSSRLGGTREWSDF